MKPIIPTLSACLALNFASHAQAQMPLQTPGSEATIYSTMPSTAAHRPEMAMDGDPSTYFQSAYGVEDGDDFTAMFSPPLAARSLRVTTGNPDGDDLLGGGLLEISLDGRTFRPAATLGADGVANAALNGQKIAALRLKVRRGAGVPSLVVREISFDGAPPLAHVSYGAGRAFSDYSGFPDLKEWARKADMQMEESWPDTAALLYSDGFITPNKVNVFYRSGPNVTGVAATGGGVMEVNVAWARAHPEDTGLTVHEVAHVVQSMSAYNPVWLIEGVADYIRWVKFEPQNYKVQINPAKATYHDSYRTTGAFLAWCELHYDSRLVSKLNRDVRFGNYSNALFKTYTGKDVDTLWSEFIAAYKADPVGIITPPIAAADRPRILPVVAAGASAPVDLSLAFNAVGITGDGARFGTESGFDAGGAAFSGALLGNSLTTQNVRFTLGAADRNNIVAARGAQISLPARKFASLWLLGAGVEGSQRAQNFVVTYSDGSTQVLAQSLSDWFAPQRFPGEARALKMAYRNLMSGAKDPRPFSLYSYGFALDANKTVQSLTLPDNPNVKIAAVTLAN